MPTELSVLQFIGGVVFVGFLYTVFELRKIRDAIQDESGRQEGSEPFNSGNQDGGEQ